jgi:hypothetical protein
MSGYNFTIDYRNRFFERVKAFDHKRAQIKSSYTLVFENLEMKLQSPKPNFANIASEWKTRLNSLDHQLDALKHEITKMDTLSKYFYRQLGEMNGKMKNKKVREREKEANEKHQREWKILRAYAGRNLKRADSAIATGRDAHMVLVGSGIRTKRETALKTLREVRHDLFSAMRRLERFANSTEILFSLEHEDLVPDEIKKMQKRRNGVDDKLKVISRAMERQLNQKGRQLQEISWAWESKYADLRYDLEALADDFENIKSLAQKYHDKSAYHIEKIVDATLREEEVENQKAHEAKLEKLYKQIAKIRQNISQDLRYGDDAYQVLINAARRRQIGDAVAKLADIRSKLQRSLKELEGALTDLLDLFTHEKKKSNRPSKKQEKPKEEEDDEVKSNG